MGARGLGSFRLSASALRPREPALPCVPTRGCHPPAGWPLRHPKKQFGGCAERWQRRGVLPVGQPTKAALPGLPAACPACYHCVSAPPVRCLRPGLDLAAEASSPQRVRRYTVASLAGLPGLTGPCGDEGLCAGVLSYRAGAPDSSGAFPSLPGQFGTGLLLVTREPGDAAQSYPNGGCGPTGWAVSSFVLCPRAHLVGCE